MPITANWSYPTAVKLGAGLLKFLVSLSAAPGLALGVPIARSRARRLDLLENWGGEAPRFGIACRSAAGSFRRGTAF